MHHKRYAVFYWAGTSFLSILYAIITPLSQGQGKYILAVSSREWFCNKFLNWVLGGVRPPNLMGFHKFKPSRPAILRLGNSLCLQGRKEAAEDEAAPGDHSDAPEELFKAEEGEDITVDKAAVGDGTGIVVAEDLAAAAGDGRQVATAAPADQAAAAAAARRAAGEGASQKLPPLPPKRTRRAPDVFDPVGPSSPSLRDLPTLNWARTLPD